MKEEKYPQITFFPAIYPHYCHIEKYEDGSGKSKYCILQDVRQANEFLAVSVIAISEDREALLNYLFDNGKQYVDYFDDE